MVNNKKMSPEVLIYIQSMKKFFNTNIEAKKYFDLEGNEEKFFEYIAQMSQKNFEEEGEPELTVLQFEELRNKISKYPAEDNQIMGVFVSFGNLGYMSLN